MEKRSHIITRKSKVEDSVVLSARTSEEVEDASKAIVQLAQGTSNGVKASTEIKEKIAGLAERLENLNQAKDMTSSQLLQGEWDLIYTTNQGNSAGKLGPFVGEVKQIIDLQEDRYVNMVTVGIIEAVLMATWITRNNRNWTVIFKDVTFKLFGIPVISKKFPDSARGDWEMTFMDDNMRILYASGKAGVRNIYILGRPEWISSNQI
eukprot:CAMPEP_0113945748 /NCGR_PEP_ID=MMETSP1339-20121228/50809_1 /TAXON_ID=94617 /ORGANISM="Fibrocapsa japonica" /LENGTH=206 /DNA_ID=CAMNT_0000951487 /DNA_START=98 /DNA_END=718 /DNA_ORIENTATION=- /assembly_acc=CAM_ASM_000762